MRPDIVVYSPDHQPRLVVEVKKTNYASSEWARRFRRNLLTHSAPLSAPYFLLVSPERLFLWQDGANDVDKEPDYEADAEYIWDRYLAGSHRDTDHLSKVSLEMVVASWLGTLSSLTEEDVESDEGLRWLYESGLSEAIKGGHVSAN